MSISMLRGVLPVACAAATVALGASAAEEKPFVPVTDQMLQHPDPAERLMWRRTLDSWGYSPLEQIDKTNVAKLTQVWSHAMGTGIQEATPLVYAGTM